MKKQARQMQEQYEKMRIEMQNKIFTGTSGNGLVTITLDGDRNMKEIKIKPECVDPTDVEGLEDLIKAAYNMANKQAEDETPDVASGLPFSL